MNYNDQIKADRRAAAAERAAERATTGFDYRDEINALYKETNVKTEKKSSTVTRLENRSAKLGEDTNRELTAIILRAMATRWTDAELKAKFMGQSKILNSIHDYILTLTGPESWTFVESDKDLSDAETNRKTDLLIAKTSEIALEATRYANTMVANY